MIIAHNITDEVKLEGLELVGSVTTRFFDLEETFGEPAEESAHDATWILEFTDTNTKETVSAVVRNWNHGDGLVYKGSCRMWNVYSKDKKAEGVINVFLGNGFAVGL